MRQPAAKEGDRIRATDMHIVLVPAGSAQVPIPLLHRFDGIIQDGLSSNVNIMGKRAATVTSVADNRPAHTPTPPGAGFQKPPTNKGTIMTGSATVRINGKAAARNADIAMTCGDPSDAPVGRVVAGGSVWIG